VTKFEASTASTRASPSNARLSALRRQGDLLQSLAQSNDDDRRVLTVAVSLSLVGSALLLKQSAAQASQTWQQGTRVSIWMQPKASAGEVANVRSQLKSLPLVKNCQFHTKAEDFAR